MRVDDSKKGAAALSRSSLGRARTDRRRARVEQDLVDRSARAASRGTSPVESKEPRPFDVARSPIGVGLQAQKSRSARAVERALETALFGAQDAKELEARLLALGFEPARKQPRSGSRFMLGKLALDVEPHRLADLDAFELTARGSRGAEKKSVLIGGVVLDKRSYKSMRDRAEHTIESFERAVDRRGGADLPATLEHLKKFLAAGEKKKIQRKERAQDLELAKKLDEVVRVLERLRDAGKLPKGIIFYVDGPDGAGKSSTGGILLEALERAGFLTRSETFKAPTDAEKKQFWLKRFERGVPRDGEAVYWDRGPAGDAVYGDPNARTLSRMAKDVERFDNDLAKRGVLQFKVELFADPEKQCETMGKRLGRRAIADRIAEMLDKRGELDAESAASLERIRGEIDPDDFRALARYPEIQGRFADFVRRTGGATPWEMLDATKRHRARLELADRFIAALEKFAAAS